MIRKPENTFIASVHRLLPKDTPYREKMNNPYRGGTPDWWYSGSKTDLWVEYKYLPRIPTRVDIVPNLSELQKLWLKGRLAEHRNLAVIVGCPSGGVILEDGRWEDQIPVATFRSQLKTKTELANWIVNYVT